MKNNIPNLNGFPNDNSPSTQLKYDIFASKLMTALHTTTAVMRDLTPMVSFGLVCSVLEVLFSGVGYGVAMGTGNYR